MQVALEAARIGGVGSFEVRLLSEVALGKNRPLQLGSSIRQTISVRRKLNRWVPKERVELVAVPLDAEGNETRINRETEVVICAPIGWRKLMKFDGLCQIGQITQKAEITLLP